MRNPSVFRLVSTLALAGLVASSIVACSESDEEVEEGTGDGSGEGSGEPTPGGNFQIRVTHASGDTPAVSIYVGDATDATITALEFGDGTSYLDLPEDSYTFNVRTADADPTSAPALTATLAPAAGDIVNVVAVGTLSAEDTVDLELIAVTEDRTAPADGSIRLRVIHAAGALPDVDVYTLGDGAPSPVLTDFLYKDASPYLDLPAGEYLFGIDADNDPTTIEARFATGAIPAGSIVTAIAAVGATGPVLIALFDDGTSATIPASN